VKCTCITGTSVWQYSSSILENIFYVLVLVGLLFIRDIAGLMPHLALSASEHLVLLPGFQNGKDIKAS
jgi:hypothetical protein